MRTGFVLGAGGATAWVFHTAVLRTLAEDQGRDLAEAEVVVGTSAGASLAAVLRGGVELEDFYRRATRPPTNGQRKAMMSELRATRKTLVPLAPGLAKHLLPGGNGATYALAGLLPPGLFPTSWLADLPGIETFVEWPEGLWVPAVRVPDAETVVFGLHRRDVPVHVAVEASSAVPGMFRPRKIGGEVFVDGGVRSSTNADLLAGVGLDRVFISAPMSRPGGGPFARNARRRLRDEIASLEAGGVETIVVEPSGEIADIARGYPRRRPEAAADIAAHAAHVTRLALATA